MADVRSAVRGRAYLGYLILAFAAVRLECVRLCHARVSVDNSCPAVPAMAISVCDTGGFVRGGLEDIGSAGVLKQR